MLIGPMDYFPMPRLELPARVNPRDFTSQWKRRKLLRRMTHVQRKRHLARHGRP